MPSPAAPKRNPVLAVVDVIASVLLVLACLGLGLTALSWGTQFLALPGTGGVVGFALIAVGVLAFAISAGMVLVNFIRRRFTFWWPLGGCILTLAAIYVGFAIVGASLGS